MKTSLLISTYNWPEALELVLESLAHQKQLPNEVLIADDGSTQETADLIHEFQRKISIPLKHIWHKDDGFRKAIILNKAVAKASGEYIIQIDGDCIMHPLFINDHLKLVKENTYLYGSRVNIIKAHVEQIITAKTVRFSVFSKCLKNKTRNIHAPVLSKLYQSSSELSSKVRGCNFSFFKSDFIKVNGYNEAFKGWGKEDSELAVRLLNNGVEGKRIRYRGIVYHIWHENESRSRESHNKSIQEKAITENSTQCGNGIHKYLK